MNLKILKYRNDLQLFLTNFRSLYDKPQKNSRHVWQEFFILVYIIFGLKLLRLIQQYVHPHG